MNVHKARWMAEANMIRPSTSWKEPVHVQKSGSSSGFDLKDEVIEFIIVGTVSYFIPIAGPLWYGYDLIFD